MFCSEKVEAECFDLIRKTFPHIPNFSFDTNFCQGQHVPTKHLASDQLAFPDRGGSARSPPSSSAGWLSGGTHPRPSPSGSPVGLSCRAQRGRGSQPPVLVPAVRPPVLQSQRCTGGAAPALPAERSPKWERNRNTPEVSPSACLVPISSGSTRWDVTKHHRAPAE